MAENDKSWFLGGIEKEGHPILRMSSRYFFYLLSAIYNFFSSKEHTSPVDMIDISRWIQPLRLIVTSIRCGSSMNPSIIPYPGYQA
jgi:hypothetical protein